MNAGGPAGRQRLPLLAFLASLLAVPAAGQSPRPAGQPGDELKVYVMTMGVGAEVWERFGHNAIIVEDRRTGVSTAYNFGMFSFRQENFLLRFIQGRMWYWMAGYPTEEDIPRYVAARRSLWRQQLNLTPAQRVQLRDLLLWNARPENRFYRYDYYRDNCSTRVRDAVDRVLGGQILRQMQGPASGTYRFHTQRLNANNLLLYTGLLLGEGEGADRTVTRWEEMFLPLKLREYLRDVRVTDSTGRPVPLVAKEDTLYLSAAFPVPDQPPDWSLLYFLAGAALGGLLYWGGRSGRRSRAAYGMLLIGGTFWALVTGLTGLILAGLWALTDHQIAARNENVLQCTLVALALAVTLPAALRDRDWALRGARVFALLVGGLSLLGVLLKVVPFFGQLNWEILALFVPANLGLAAGVVRWVGGWVNGEQ